jgi:hypothetical protein
MLTGFDRVFRTESGDCELQHGCPHLSVDAAPLMRRIHGSALWSMSASLAPGLPGRTVARVA